MPGQAGPLRYCPSFQPAGDDDSTGPHEPDDSGN